VDFTPVVKMRVTVYSAVVSIVVGCHSVRVLIDVGSTVGKRDFVGAANAVVNLEVSFLSVMMWTTCASWASVGLILFVKMASVPVGRKVSGRTVSQTSCVRLTLTAKMAASVILGQGCASVSMREIIQTVYPSAAPRMTVMSGSCVKTECVFVSLEDSIPIVMSKIAVAKIGVGHFLTVSMGNVFALLEELFLVVLIVNVRLRKTRSSMSVARYKTVMKMADAIVHMAAFLQTAGKNVYMPVMD